MRYALALLWLVSSAVCAQKKVVERYVQSPIFVNDFYTNQPINAKITHKGAGSIKGSPLNLFAPQDSTVQLHFEADDYGTVDRQLTMTIETLLGDGLFVKMTKKSYTFGFRAQTADKKSIENVIFRISTATQKEAIVTKTDAMLSPKLVYEVVAVADGYQSQQMQLNAHEWLSANKALVEFTLLPVAPKATLGVIEKGKVVTLNGIFFDQSSPTLRTNSYAQLDELRNFLTQNPQARIEIRGYTDNVGDWDMNVQLAKDRCQSVVNYLTKKGIEASRLRMVGRGPLDPVAPNTTEENRKKNRRVTFVVL